jgi:N-carbamoylputrescine amidase
VSHPSVSETPFSIGVIQDRADADPQVSIARSAQLVRDAAGRGAQIICLKELFSSPYFCKAEHSDRFDLAEPIPGPTTDRMQALAKELGVVLIVPIFERQAAGVYRNTAAVIDADGSLLGVYRKMHIPDDPLFYEKYYFSPGDTSGGSAAGAGPASVTPASVIPASGNAASAMREASGNAASAMREARGFRVWKTRFATIGVLICWDQWYPEAARITSLLGAQVLFYPTAIGWHPDEKDEWGRAQVDAWRTAQRAHAIANGVYVAAPNRVGHEEEQGTRGITFFGQSFICDPFGRYVAEAGEQEEILIAKCDPALIETVRRNWPFLRDRRIDAYEPILNRYLGS